MQNTPNAERYVLEADAMRRRQLRSALLHGSRRTWREHTRIWPAVVVGLIVVAVVVAGLAVTQAFRKTEENEKKEQQQQDRPPSSAPATPGPKATR
jgi:flagellar biosynthesis/type III secretory pathway M-ring protein FliF/YscJ